MTYLANSSRLPSQRLRHMRRPAISGQRESLYETADEQRRAAEQARRFPNRWSSALRLPMAAN